MITNPWDTSCVLDRIAWCWSMLWYPVWLNLTFTWCKSPTLQTYSLRSMGYRGLQLFYQLSLQIDSPIWSPKFELWFIGPKDFILLFYFPVFVHLGPQEPFDIFASSTVVFRQQLCYTGQLQCMLTLSRHCIGSIAQWYFNQSAFCQASWWMMKSSSALVVALVCEPYIRFCYSRFLVFPNSIIQCRSGNFYI